MVYAEKSIGCVNSSQPTNLTTALAVNSFAVRFLTKQSLRERFYARQPLLVEATLVYQPQKENDILDKKKEITDADLYFAAHKTEQSVR